MRRGLPVARAFELDRLVTALVEEVLSLQHISGKLPDGIPDAPPWRCCAFPGCSRLD